MNNGLLFQAFEWYLEDSENYYVEMLEKIDDLKALKVNAVWLPPFMKATGVTDTGYGIYDLWDLGEFDQKGAVRTKYGTKDELLALVKALHENDIAVYADIVLNHKAGADETERFMAIEVDENDRNTPIGEAKEIEGWTAFNFENRHNKYSDFKWNFNHFSGIDYDNLSEQSGVFKIVGENKGWSLAVSKEKGNFDYLMFADIDHAHPEVVAELKKWITWLIDEVNLDGVRFDALKHIDEAFIIDYITHIKSVAKDDFYLLGEYWENDAKIIDDYVTNLDFQMDLFDVVLHFNLYEASLRGSDYDLRTIFDNSLVSQHPTLAVTFVDNHDSQPNQSLESFVDPWFKEIAYGLILLRKDGYPCLFYGDYYGLHQTDPNNSLKDKILLLAKLRDNFAYGDQDNYFNDPNCIGWIRHGDSDHPHKCAVVISNGEMNTLRMFIGKEEANKIYRDYTTNNHEEVIIDEEGYGDFMVSPGSISVWVEENIEI